MARRAKLAVLAAGLAGVLLGQGALTAVAQDQAMDPGQRAVRGSCADSYIPVFAAARDVTFEGDYARLAVKVAVTRDPETGAVLHAAPSAESVKNLPEAAVARVLEGLRAAYLRPEPADCRGVITGREAWVLRFGEITALAAPDDPLMINRATAATRLRQRTGAVELVDPTTAQPRLTRIPDLPAGTPQRCYTSELWRDYGPLPPVELMAKGESYRLRFYVDAGGRAQQVEVITLNGGRTPSPELKEAAERYVTHARFYPPITHDCRTRNATASLVIGRN